MVTFVLQNAIRKMSVVIQMFLISLPTSLYVEMVLIFYMLHLGNMLTLDIGDTFSVISISPMPYSN